MSPPPGITIKRHLKARPETVFDAWTRPEVMADWFFPGEHWTARVQCDLRIGGRYELVMRDTEGRDHLQFGTYLEIVPSARLVFTWSCPDLAVTDSVVTVDLAGSGSGTDLTLTHVLPDQPKIRRGHEEGWIGCLGQLERLLDGPQDTKETT